VVTLTAFLGDSFKDFTKDEDMKIVTLTEVLFNMVANRRTPSADFEKYFIKDVYYIRNTSPISLEYYKGPIPIEVLQKCQIALSFAAMGFNQALHQSDVCPKWMVNDRKKNFFVYDDSGLTAKEGIELLTRITGEYVNYSAESPPDFDILLRCPIGFNLDELAPFLDKNQIKHNLCDDIHWNFQKDTRWTWKEIAKELDVALKTAQNMNNATDRKYIRTPGQSGGRKGCMFTTKAKIHKMEEEYKKMIKK
jgi:hypothetical protein